jgi:hypothetical protein
MKGTFFAIAILIGGLAQAEDSHWAEQLETYKQNMQNAPDTLLWANNAFYTAGSVATCSMSAAIAAATFVSDTVPVGNIISETVANVASLDYHTYESLKSWETLGQIGRGAVGGGAIAMVDALKFVVLWLGGQEARGFESAKKVYASTFETMNVLFAREGQCLMNVSRVFITREEIKRRRTAGLQP